MKNPNRLIVQIAVGLVIVATPLLLSVRSTRAEAELSSSASVPRELHEMALTALPPRLVLHSTLGQNADWLFHGNHPTASGQVVCSTGDGSLATGGPGVAKWDTLAACGLAALSGATFTGAVTFSNNVTATAGTNSFTGTLSSSSLTLGAGGAVIAASYKGTTSTLPTVSAQSCANLATHITVASAAAGSTCDIGLPSGFAVSLSVECWADGAGTVQIKFCNPTAGSITPTAGTYTVRVIQ